VRWSLEIRKIVEAEPFIAFEGNMRGAAMRGFVAPPRSKTTSRRQGMPRRLKVSRPATGTSADWPASERRGAEADDDPSLQGLASVGNLIRREAYVLAYIDGFWIIAWVMAGGIVLLLLLRPPPANPLTPPRSDL
jgi:hypothetical protein